MADEFIKRSTPFYKNGPNIATKVSGDNLGLNTNTPAGQFHTVLSAGKPALFGGDALATVTGVSGTDASPTVLTVSTTNGIAIGDAVIVNSGTNVTIGTYFCTAVTVDTSVTLNKNASSGGAISAASVTYVNDALVIENGTNGEPRVILPLTNDAANPTMAFGDGDTGLYEQADDLLRISLNGTAYWQISTSYFGMYNGSSLQWVAVSDTAPSLTPHSSDSDTGIGHAAADALSLIAGGVEGHRITEFGSKAYNTFGGTGIANLTSCTFLTATKTQISKTGVGTGVALGDLVYVSAGTGAILGAYKVEVVDSADLITVDRDIHAEGTDITDGTVSTIKDAVLVSPTDGTNGQRIMGYSHQNKPLQIGGDTLLAPSYVANTGQSPDVQVGKHLILPLENDAATPTLAFGNGDSGFYESTDDNISISINSNLTWSFTSGWLGASSLGAIISKSAPTATVPSLVMSQSDINTGIGSAGVDQLSLIAGATEGIRVGVNHVTTMVGQIVHKTDQGASDYNPSILTSDYIVTVDTSAAARAVIISTEDRDTGTADNVRIFIIKDIAGNASVNNITVSIETAGNIEFAANYVINVNGGSITLAIDGTNGYII